MSSDLPIKKVHIPTASQLEKLQKKQTQKFEKASARQLYKNISKGTVDKTVDKREMETKSFGKRSIEDLRGKVTAKEEKISTKEKKQFTATKKVVHAFQRVKNWMLAGEFENNMKLLQMAKTKLPESKKPEPVKEEPDTKLVEEPAQEEPVKEEPVQEPAKEEPVVEPAKAEPKKKVVKVVLKKITHKEAVIKSINELAFNQSALVDTFPTRGTAILTLTNKEGVYEIHYRKEDDTVVTARLEVIDAKQMFLEYKKGKKISCANLKRVLEAFARHYPGPLIAPPLEEGKPNRKFVPQQAE